MKALKIWLFSLLLLVLVGVTVYGQFHLKSIRDAEEPALADGVYAALGGLRSIAAEIIWCRADRLQREGQFVELAELANTLALMEPHTSEVWSYAAWNLAYNVSVMMPSYEDRWRWMDEAIHLLRDRGLKLNPHSAELYRELAWLFELKMGTHIDPAAPLYREHWKAIVEDVKARDAWEELGMDRKLMLAVEKASGFHDWTNPQLSAIYWAMRGLKHASGNERMMLMAIIQQSTILYSRL